MQATLPHSKRLFIRAAAVAGLLTSAPAAVAEKLPLFSRTDLVDTWGSLIYCQGIYEEPDVRGRVYQGDLQACSESGQRIKGLVNRDYSPAQARQIALDSARKAAAIRHNTRSIQDAVAACRKQCRTLSAASE